MSRAFPNGIPNKYLYIDNERGDYTDNYIIGNNIKIDIYFVLFNTFKNSFISFITFFSNVLSNLNVI